MRLFFGARRQLSVGVRPKRYLLLMAMIAVLSLVVAPLAYAGSHHGGHANLHRRAKHVHHRVHRVSGQLEEASSWVVHATSRLRAAEARLQSAHRSMVRVQGRLTTARATAKRIQGQLTNVQSRLDAAVTAVRTARDKVVAQRDATAGSVIDYSTAHNPAIAAFQSYVTAGSLDDLTTSETGQDIVVGQEKVQLTALQRRQVELQRRQQDVRKVRDQVQARRTAAQHTVLKIRALVKKVVVTKHRFEHEVARTRRAHATAVRARAADRARLRHLRAQEARIERRILAATARAGNRHIGSTHGVFQPPVRHSYITSPYGWRRHPIYHYWGLHDGDDLHAPCGVPERAVGPGKVISQYYSDVWGHRLYLGLGRINGHGYVAIYNHISAYRSRVGQRVRAGQTIALAGTSGWSTACHLHFTLMRDGRAVDPAPYIGF